MPRGKIGMKLIENPKKRRESYKNRRDGLVQKTSQLATLCGVDAVLVCFDPKNAGSGQHNSGGAAAVTTWPADREEAVNVINKYRETPGDKIKHSLTATTYYQEELAKQQRKLVKIEQCGPDMLSLQDCRLADLSLTDLGALLGNLDETLLKVQQRIVALGGQHVVHDDEDHTPAADYNSFDLAFSTRDDAAGSMVTQYNNPPREMLPQPQAVPLQPPSLAYHQMPLPRYTFQMPPLPSYTFHMPLPSYTFQMPQPTLKAPLDHLGINCNGTNGTGTKDFTPFAMNFPNVAATVPGFYDNFMPAIDAVGGGVYVDDYVVSGGQDFATGDASAGYQNEHHMNAGVWPMSKMNNDPGPMDAAAFQERNDFTWLPDISSSSTSTGLQGGFQKK